MSSDDPLELDPQVLADPLGDEPSEDQAAREESKPKPGVSKALVPAGERGLAPYDPLRRYKAEIRRYPPLTREEEQALARRYRETGDRDALFRLITSNLMLVVRIAHSFQRAARNVLDLIQEGNIGLLQAIQRFDPELDVRLPTYAAWWIRAYMVKFLLDNVRLVRVGTTNARRKLLRNLRKEKARLEAEGFEVGPKLLAEHFGVSEQDVRDVEAALDSRDVSIDAPTPGEDDRPRAEQMTDESAPDVEESVARRELQARVEEALSRFRKDLKERDLALLDERILADDPLTLQALGDRFGTSREAVRQAEARLMARLKSFLEAELGESGQIQVGAD
jgi:RNA polymerase sigma-32 factor